MNYEITHSQTMQVTAKSRREAIEVCLDTQRCLFHQLGPITIDGQEYVYKVGDPPTELPAREIVQVGETV